MERMDDGMARFTNKGVAVTLFGPVGHPEAMLVEANAPVEVPGEAIDGGDAWITGGEGDNARAWPKEVWQLDAPPRSGGSGSGSGSASGSGSSGRNTPPATPPAGAAGKTDSADGADTNGE